MPTILARAAALAAAALLAAPAAALAQTTERPPFDVIATFGPDTPPGNVAVGPDGRIFMSLHQFYGPATRVVELTPDGGTRPYPTEAWAAAPDAEAQPGSPGLNGVLGLRVDRRGVLWLLDGQTESGAGRLIGWDTRAERLHQIVTLAAPVTAPDTFLNDLAIDRIHDAAYIADTGGPESAAIIVVDLSTGAARRVLAGSRFTVAEDVDMVIDGRVVTLGGAPARIGINPITLDPIAEWLYFGAMNGRSVYRIRTADLRDPTLSDAELEARVERYGDKPISDGSTIDGAGNVYITDIGASAVGVTRPDGAYEVLYQGDDLPWPDGFAFGPDGRIYATINELHRSPPLNDGENGAQGAFKLIAFPALAPGAQGR